jgi:hypothetical protein
VQGERGGASLGYGLFTWSFHNTIQSYTRVRISAHSIVILGHDVQLCAVIGVLNAILIPSMLCLYRSYLVKGWSVQALLSAQVLPIFLVFVAPGVVAATVFNYLVSSVRKKLADYLVELITFSMFYLALFFWLVGLLYVPVVQAHAFLFYPLVLLAVFVVPACLGWLGNYLLRSHRLRQFARLTAHPDPMAWDYIFNRNRSYWVIFHLKNGKMIGGYYSGQSFVSRYPDDQDIYVEQIWHLDKFGRFRNIVDRSMGGYIKAKDCDLIELLSV